VILKLKVPKSNIFYDANQDYRPGIIRKSPARWIPAGEGMQKYKDADLPG